jgi:hypothetical protein
MKLHYHLSERDGRQLASCREVEVEAWGASTVEALEALRRAVREALYSDEAVGPPSRAEALEAIELVAEAPRGQSVDGPGDVLPPRKGGVPTAPT